MPFLRSKQCPILAVGIFFFFGVLLQAQNYLVHTYNENDGLRSSMVYDIAQDALGRMWFATRTGISVFDGVDWISYTVADGLEAPNYVKLRIDAFGIVWVLPGGADFSLSYFEGNQWSPLPRPEFPFESNFTTFEVLSQDRDVTLAVGTESSGIYLYKGGGWKIIDKSDGLPSNEVTGIMKKENQFFVATKNGIAVIEGEKVIDYFKEKFQLPSPAIFGLAKEETGSEIRIWLLGETWTGYVQNSHFHLLSNSLRFTFEKNSPVFALQPDLKGGVYFGNTFGVYHVHGETGRIEPIGKKSGLISEGATEIFWDRENNLWISSLRGVSKIVSQRFANYSEANGLLEDEVTAIAEVSRGRYVFGHPRGITFYDGEKFSRFPFHSSQGAKIFNTRVLDLAVDGEKNIWVAASDLGLAKTDGAGRIQWFREESGLTGRVTSVVVDQMNTVRVAIQSSLYEYINGRFVELPRGIGSALVRKIFYGRDNSLLLATAGSGISHRIAGEWRRYLSVDGNEFNNVYSILEDSRGRVWVGTLGGLCVLENRTIKPYRAGDIEITRPVYFAVEDQENRIWFGTDHGAIRLSGGQLRHFTVAEGLAGLETNRSAGLVDTGGRVWIGADLGVSLYQPEFDYGLESIPAPIVELKYIDALGEILPFDRTHSFGYKTNTLLFHFYASSFIDEKQVYFRSRLLGFDPEWMPESQSRNREIRYTNLPPGRYQFQIQVRNSLGVWSEIVTSQDIVIRKPFWKEWWFFGLLGLFVALVTFSIQRFFSARRYSIQLERQVKERTAELQESENRYRRMIESNMAVMLLVDPESRKIMEANPEACRFYGRSPEELMGASFDDLNAEPTVPADGGQRIEGKEARSSYVIAKHRLGSSEARDVEIYSCPVQIQSIPYQFKIIHDITYRIKAEEKLKAALKEKDVMLREIHHRVKNNLQIISSLLRLQSGTVKDPKMKDMFKLSQNKIKAMALIHDRLYRSHDLTRIDFSDYIRSLADNLFSMYDDGLAPPQFEQNVNDVYLDINYAIPCGLIINELVTNSFKHAFPKGISGKISVGMVREISGKYCLVVKDTGIGFPEKFDFDKAESLGMRLVVDLVRQIEGQIDINRDEGTCITITF